MQSGAFEIYVNDKLMFSKLESGKMPNINDIHLIFS
jgi:selT/selW/selH-like putative selenoprotein